MASGIGGPIGSASASDPVVGDPAPSLLSPADDPSGVSPLKDLVLSWTPVAHADSYAVQMSPNGDWTNNTVTLPEAGVTVNTTYEVPVSLPHTFYYWRVRGLHGDAHTAWSQPRTFLREWYQPFSMLKVPTDTDPSLSWQPVQGASLYRVRFSETDDFSDPAVTFTCYTQQTTFSPYATNMAGAERLAAGGCFDAAALKQDATYYWELVAYDDTTDGEVVADTANDAGWECAQAQPECNTYLPASTYPTPTFTFQAPLKGNYANGVATGLRTTWHASTATATDCTAGTCPMTPTFSWDPVAGANYYEVHVWRDPGHLNTYRVFDTSYTSVTPREGLFDAQAGSGYYWSVRAGTCAHSTDEPYCAAPPDTAPSVSCPDTAAVTTPPTIADGTGGMSVAPAGPNGAQSMSAGQTGTVTLVGSDFVDGACVMASSAGGVVSNVAVVDDAHITFNYAAPASAMSVTFTVVNPDGGTSNASMALDVFGSVNEKVLGPAAPAVTFRKASSAIALNAPANDSETSDNSVTFSWDPYLGSDGAEAYDVRNYHLQVARDPDFDKVTWDFSSIDLTQFTNPTALLPDGTWYWRVQGIDESDNPLTWSRTRTLTKDSTAPQLHLAGNDGVAVDAAFTIKASEPVSGVSSSTVHLVPATGGRSVSGTVAQTGTSTWKLQPSHTLATGQVYRLAVGDAVQDGAGNRAVITGHGLRTATAADDKGPALAFSGSWSRHVSSQALGGTFRSGPSGRSVKVDVAGTSLKVFGCRGPEFGTLVVAVDGTRRATVNEHLSYTKCGVLLWKGKLDTHSAHSVKLVAAGGTGNVDQVRVG